MPGNKGKLVIISAPSGAGKTTIVKELLERDLNLQFSVSACNRLPREGERDGIDYYFLSDEEFKQKIKDDAFVEWEEVYENQYYGTLKSEVERIRNMNKNVIFDIDVKGGINLKKQYGHIALSIFIKPPSLDVLKQRLRNRYTETEESLQKRFERASFELGFSSYFDEIVENIDLKLAIDQTENIISRFINN